MIAWVKVADAQDIPPGRTKEVTVGEAKLLVCNVDGRLFAVGDVCTHDDGPLGQGALEGCEIECPRHGARFDVRTGKALCLPAILPLPTHDIKVEGSSVFVAEPATMQR